MNTLMQDLKYGLRMLWKSPAFTIVAVVTLALGIGANAAIFSVVNGVLLSALPYKDASRLIVMNETTPKVGLVSVSYPNFLDWRVQSHVFPQMAAVDHVGFNISGVSQPENISGEAVSPNYLSMLGMRPYLGRDFEPAEEKPGTAPVVMLSYSLWQSHLGADRNAIGRTIALDGRSFTIIGVLPPNYLGIDDTDVMVPIGVWATHNPSATDRGDRGDMVVVGRLARGASLAQARAELKGIAAQLAKEYPATNDRFSVAVQPIRDVFVGDIRPAILVLFGAVAFVLLIACANVANLFLVRGAVREREIAVRLAFGASRWRVVRQMLAESLLLAAIGGALGILFGAWGTGGLTRLLPAGQFGNMNIHMNGSVLLFVGAVVILVAIAFGLAPAMQASQSDVQEALKEGGRSATAGSKQHRLRGVLAVTEISMAMILLVGAGLMMRSLYRLMAVNPGFQTAGILTMEMDLRTQQYAKDPAILGFWQQVLEKVRALPGVESAALGTVIPLTDSHDRVDITIEGMPLLRPGDYPHPDIHIVSPGYARTLGVSLLRGRTFTDADNEKAPRAAMINEMIARKFFPHQDPIGKRFMFGRPSPNKTPEWWTIVGVLGDTKLYGLANLARLEVYVPYRQAPDSHMNLLVKSAANPAALITEIRGVVASLDRNQPIFAISTMKQLESDSVSTQRVTLILLGLFSTLALVLAAIGIYGVISYSVTLRAHEIGVRMALGAQRRDVLRLVLGQGGKLAGVGIVIGLGIALALTRLMSSLLFRVSTSDPLIYAGVAALLALVALAACYLPARRAMRTDPMDALRYE
jgi:putative ABC transport system permease protein